MMILSAGCKSYQISDNSACYVGFDYSDCNVNQQNKRALLKHFCICNPDNEVCKEILEDL